MESIRVPLQKNTYQKLFLIFQVVCFVEGAPINTMLYVDNGYFRICRESTVVSLVNGGSPPCFFEENVYKMLCDLSSVDLQNLSIKEHLASKEVEQVRDILIFKNVQANRNEVCCCLRNRL